MSSKNVSAAATVEPSGPAPLLKLTHTIPPPVGRSKRQFPFASMKIGESFFVPWDDRVKGMQPVVNDASRFRKKNPKFKFTSRTVIEGGVRGMRTWCIESPNGKK